MKKGGASEKREGAVRTAIRVVDPAGGHHPFLRGMVTHDLVQRGLSFDDAYAAAHALRDRLAGKEEISTSELKDHLQQQLEEMFGVEVYQRLGEVGAPGKSLEVEYDGQVQPFSRGLLARSLYAAGVDLDRAYRLVSQLQSELAAEGVQRLSNSELALRTGDLLGRQDGANVASRYRLMRGMRRLPKPVVLYIAGAGGTGKSTLAVDLAPLLRIFRINATDTIRQVMRMVFSPAILPSLHRSSFEVDPFDSRTLDESLEGASDGDQRQQIVAAFEEQAVRVLVGVRGVVERSVAENTSLIVEGVHLIPPHIPFADLQGSSYQILLTLTTLDRELHRGRFLHRGSLGLRRAERYLDRFEAIRMIQDHLLNRSESHGVPLVDTADAETTLRGTLRLLSSMLEKQVPQLGMVAAEAEARIPALLLIIDGMPDRPVRALGSRTPVQAAQTPTLDQLAREGRCGLADPIAPDVVPDTAAGSLALFGQSPMTIHRGPVEALGAGLTMEPGDVALRANFASLDERGDVIDRRAGRIREDAMQLAEALDGLKIPGAEDLEVLVRSSTEHRVAVVLRGPELSSAIIGSDPGDGAPLGPPLEPQPLDPADPSATRTAKVLALFEEQAREVLARHPVNLRRRSAGELPANALLTRGAGHMHKPLPLDQVGLPSRLTCISGDGTVLGIASWLGAEIRTSQAMTANLDTDLRAKFQVALDALRSRDLVVLHVKGADIAAHDQRPDLKASFLEALDRRLDWFLNRWKGPLRIAVASDHGTLSESGQHSSDPVPVLLWGPGIEEDSVQVFDEHAAAGGSLQRFPLQLLVPRLFEAAS